MMINNLQTLLIFLQACQLSTAFVAMTTKSKIGRHGWHPIVTLTGASALAQSIRTSAPPRTNILAPVSRTPSTTSRKALVQDLNVVGLVAGQENYGLAIVCLGEAIWSLLQAPSVSYAFRLLVPAGIGAVVLWFVSGPMIQSGDADSVGLGLGIATTVSLLLGANYVLRLMAPYSPSPKEIAALGFLLSVAGFVSFTQNLLVDGFVALPSIDLPSLPSFELPSIELPSVEMPSVELPSVELPSTTELPSAELPSTDLPAMEVPSATELP